MTPQLPARRRAERFHSLVEDSLARGSSDALPGERAELADLLQTVTTLRSTPPVTARPEFVADLRERLMLAAQTALAPDTAEQLAARRAPAPRRSARDRRIATAIGGLAIVSATGTMAVAAQSALPGDTLYPLKRAIESAHAGALGSDNGSTLLDNASGRLDEVDELSRNGDDDPEIISETLRDFAEQADEASTVLLDAYAEDGEAAPIEELRNFAATSMADLDRLESVLPAQARDSLVVAARTLTRIDQLAMRVCPTCSASPVAALTDPLVDSTSSSLEDLLLGGRQDATPVRDPGTSSPSKPKPRGDTTPSDTRTGGASSGGAKQVDPSTQSPVTPTATPTPTPLIPAPRRSPTPPSRPTPSSAR